MHSESIGDDSKHDNQNLMSTSHMKKGHAHIVVFKGLG